MNDPELDSINFLDALSVLLLWKKTLFFILTSRDKKVYINQLKLMCWVRKKLYNRSGVFCRSNADQVATRLMSTLINKIKSKLIFEPWFDIILGLTLSRLFGVDKNILSELRKKILWFRYEPTRRLWNSTNNYCSTKFAKLAKTYIFPQKTTQHGFLFRSKRLLRNISRQFQFLCILQACHEKINFVYSFQKYIFNSV